MSSTTAVGRPAAAGSDEPAPPADDPGGGGRSGRPAPPPKATFRGAMIDLHTAVCRAGLTGHWAAVGVHLDALTAGYRPILDALARKACASKQGTGVVEGTTHALLVILIAAEAIRFADRAVRKFKLPSDFVADVANTVNLILDKKLRNPERVLTGWATYGNLEAFVNRIAHNEASDLAGKEDRQSGRRLVRLIRELRPRHQPTDDTCTAD